MSAELGADRLLAALAARSPQEIVLQGETQTWRAAELLVAIHTLAERLAETRVLAVLADNGPAWIIADLAALHAQTVHLPLPNFFSAAQLAHSLQASGADTLLTDQPQRIAALDLGFALQGKCNGLAWMQRAHQPLRLPPGTAKLSFTSGSSGTPKGVCLAAAGLLATAQAVAERLNDLPIENHLACLPLPLLLENSAGIYAPLLRAATLSVPGLAALGWRGMAAFDAAALQREALAAHANSLILVPELLKAWTQWLTACGQVAPPELRYVAVGGARVSPRLLSEARRVGIPAYQGYGLTECGSVLSLNHPGDAESDSDAGGANDVGRPLAHARVRIDDGEIKVTTRAFLGYVGASADEWAAPASCAEGIEFATGDLGHVDAAGHLHLSGRRKNLLITSYGRNVAPEWVESVLLGETAIAQAAVFGDARPWLCAVLVASPGASQAELAAAVARANAGLPDYARVVRWIGAEPFSAQNALATGNGRPLRAAIFAQHSAELLALYKPRKGQDAVL